MNFSHRVTTKLRTIMFGEISPSRVPFLLAETCYCCPCGLRRLVRMGKNGVKKQLLLDRPRTQRRAVAFFWGKHFLPCQHKTVLFEKTEKVLWQTLAKETPVKTCLTCREQKGKRAVAFFGGKHFLPCQHRTVLFAETEKVLRQTHAKRHPWKLAWPAESKGERLLSLGENTFCHANMESPFCRRQESCRVDAHK